MFEKLAESVVVLAAEIGALRRQRQHEFDWHKSNHGLVTKLDLEQMEKRIMAKESELIETLKSVLAQQQKTATEIKGVQDSVDALKAKIVELEDIIAKGSEPSQELADAVAAVKAQAQVVDDQIPDAPVPPPEPA